LAHGKTLISRPESRVVLLLVPTDEELMIAQHTLAFLPKQNAQKAAGFRDDVELTSRPEVL
jgi:hypothetical protein